MTKNKKTKQDILKAVEDMNTYVKRVKAGSGHRYLGNVEKLKDKQIAGVTTVSGQLSGFTTNIAASYGAKKMYEALGGYDKIEGVDHGEDLKFTKGILKKLKEVKSIDEYLKIIEKAKKGHKRHSDKAKDIGTDGHKIIEDYVNASLEQGGKPLKEGGYIGQKWIDNALRELYVWFNENIEEFYLSEELVCMIEPYKTHTHIQGKDYRQIRHTEYAGTLDMIAKLKNGKLAVLDPKFAERIGRDYKVQLAAYAKTFEPYGIEVPERITIRLPKTEFLKVYKDYKYKQVENKLEIKNYPEDKMEFDFQAFLHAREVYRWKNAN